uniref:PB1 domain-containing protein n=1 Tax=Mesocestoides corti TaxID=53468 RepID=A0A5K3ERV7_MESCO
MRAPALHESESCGHVSRQGEVWLDPNQTISEDADLEEVDVPPSRPQQEGRVALGVELEPETPIRLVRQTAACISVCGSRFRIFHALYNSLDIRDTNETHYLELSSENLQAVKAILDAYPASIEICDLPGSSIDSKMVLANSLYETGLIITTQPLPPCPWDASSSEDIEME